MACIVTEAFQQDEDKSSGNGAETSDDFHLDTKARYDGIVTFYNKKRGYGFIELSDKGIVPDDRLFVHWEDIKSTDRYPFLVKDLKVSFNITRWRQQATASTIQTTLRAKNVSMPIGDPIAVQDARDRKKEFVGSPESRYIGTLKFYDPMRGFGYVLIDLLACSLSHTGVPGEIRVERAEINTGGAPHIPLSNIKVEFGIWKTKGGAFKAYNMTFPDGVSAARYQWQESSEKVTSCIEEVAHARKSRKYTCDLMT